jgi:hypothetical protein
MSDRGYERAVTSGSRNSIKPLADFFYAPLMNLSMAACLIVKPRTTLSDSSIS